MGEIFIIVELSYFLTPIPAYFPKEKIVLKHFPDFNEMASINVLKEKSSVLHLGLDLSRFDRFKLPKERNDVPIILWNHRWEYDKNPKDFFNALYKLVDAGKDFKVALLGENFSQVPKEFEEAKKKLGDRIIHFGYAESFEEYAKWLWRADVLPVTSNHDFFGASVVEAIYCGCYPVLPNRLAYPYFFPGEKYKACFYKDGTDMVKKLKEALDNKNISSFQDAVVRFRWEEMAPVYDAAIEKMT